MNIKVLEPLTLIKNKGITIFGNAKFRIIVTILKGEL